MDLPAPAAGYDAIHEAQAGIGFLTTNENPGRSRVIGLDAKRGVYQTTRYTLKDTVNGDLLLVKRGEMPIAILDVVLTYRVCLAAEMFAIDRRYQIEIGDDVVPFHVIEEKPVR